MPNRYVINTCTDSGSAGNCKVAEAVNLTFNYNGAYYDDCNTKRNSAYFNFTSGKLTQRFMVPLRVAGTTGTVTFTVEEAGVTKATQVVNVSSLLPNTAGEYWVEVQIASPYTATGAQLRLTITCSVASRVYWRRSITAGDYSFIAVGNADDASGVGNGDLLLIAPGASFTQNQARTYAPVNGHSIVIGSGASYLATSAAAYTLDLGAGDIVEGADSYLQLGTSGSPITAANKITINNSLPLNSSLLCTPTPYYSNITAATISNYYKFYGEEPSGLGFYVNAAAAGQNVVTTPANIPASFVDGDLLKFIGKDKNTADGVTYYGKKTSAQQLTLYSDAGLTTPVNLDVALVANAYCVNYSLADRGCGIKINSTNNIWLCSTTSPQVESTFSVIGTYMVNVVPYTGVFWNTPPTIRSCVFNLDIDTMGCYLLQQWTGSATGATVQDVFIGNKKAGYGVIMLNAYGANITRFGIQGFGGSGSTNSTLINAGCSLTDCVFAQGYSSTYWIGAYIRGTGHTFNRVYFIGSGIYLNANACKFYNVTQQRSLTSGLVIDGAVKNEFINSQIGVGSTNSQYDISNLASTYSETLFTNCTRGSKGVDPGITSALFGTYDQFHNDAGVEGDHRTWKPEGNFTTDSPSYTNLVQTCTQSSNTCEHIFELLTETVAGDTFKFTCDVNIDAAYDNGTYTWPHADIYVDDNPTTGTPDATVSASAVGSSSLSVNFTPTTNSKKVRVVFRAKTDQTNAPVKWSNAHVYTAIWGYKVIDLPLNISETLTYPIGTIATPVSNPFISITSAAAAALSSKFTDSTDFEWNDDGTIDEAYAYATYLKIQTPTITKAIDTIDGVNFTGAKGVTIDSGKVASGTSSQRLDLGSYSLTATGDDFSSGLIITDTNGTYSPLVLTGLVTGSTVYLHNDTDSTTILKATVAATSKQKIVLLSGNKTISGRVDYCSGTTAYIPFNISAQSIGVNGLTIPISQRSDTAYNDNAKDGSSVTQVTLSGSDPDIHVDDPDNDIAFQEIYAAYRYLLSTTSYIDIQQDRITGNTALDFTMDGIIKLYNDDAVNTLTVRGANVEVSDGSDPVNPAGGRINFRASRAGVSVQEIAGAVGTSNPPIWPHIVFK